VTLKGPQGNVVDVVAGDEVKNFDQIKVGDFVVVRYAEALTLELRKTKSSAGDIKCKKGRAGAAGRAAGSCRRTAGHCDRRCHRCGSEEEHDHAERAEGQCRYACRAQSRSVQGREEGRQVEVTYTEALALSVEPASKPTAAKE
jgi:hypothetical protein